MRSKRVSKRSKDKGAKDKGAKKDKKQKSTVPGPEYRGELVILTGLSGSGKLSALKAFADLVRQSAEIERAALVVDVREGMRLDEFPTILKSVRKVLPTHVVFLEASEG